MRRALAILVAAGTLGAGAPKAPKKTATSTAAAVEANNNFAIALFHRLAAGHPGENLFFSPYSLSQALAMVAVGARGKTALEMGQVLGFPAAARNSGPDAAERPWRMSVIDDGFAQLNRTFDSASVHAAKAMAARRKLAELRRQKDEVDKKQTTQLYYVDEQEFDRLAQRSKNLDDQIRRLTLMIDQPTLTVANALWCDKSDPLAPSYMDAVKASYGAGVFGVDFHGDFSAARKKISHWVERETQRHIRDIVPVPRPDETRRGGLVVTDVIYFMGKWNEAFFKEDTAYRNFTLASGLRERTLMMHDEDKQQATYGAFKANGSLFPTPDELDVDPATGRFRPGGPRPYPGPHGFAMIELPYRGGELSMLVIAPDSPSGLPAIEERLNPTTLDRWIGQLEQREVDVYLPKFKFDTNYPLADALMAMGMTAAFSPDSANFSGMLARKASRDRFYLNSVLHQTVIDVDENGTSAAAATEGSFDLGETPFIPTFRADRPFLFLIRERSTGAILFIGRMSRPRSAAELNGDFDRKPVTQRTGTAGLGARGTGPGAKAGKRFILRSSVLGGLTADEVARVVDQHIRQVAHCCEVELYNDPNLTCDAKLAWVIQPDGSVTDMRVTHSVLNARAEACIVANVRRWKFPAARGGGIVKVTYPLALDGE